METDLSPKLHRVWSKFQLLASFAHVPNPPSTVAGKLAHRLIRNVHEDRKYANVSKLMGPDRVNHSSVSVH